MLSIQCIHLLQTVHAVHGRQQSLRVCHQTMADRFSGLAFYAGVSSAGLKVRTTDRMVDTEMWHFQFNSFIISKPYRWYKRYKAYEHMYIHTVFIQMVLLMSQYKQSGWPELTYFACGEQIYENTEFSFFLNGVDIDIESQIMVGHSFFLLKILYNWRRYNLKVMRFVPSFDIYIDCNSFFDVVLFHRSSCLGRRWLLFLNFTRIFFNCLGNV